MQSQRGIRKKKGPAGKEKKGSFFLFRKRGRKGTELAIPRRGIKNGPLRRNKKKRRGGTFRLPADFRGKRVEFNPY